jgi:hypothetical protein
MAARRRQLATFKLLAAVLLGSLASAAIADGQGAPYHEQLWNWLQKNNYKHWADVSNSDGDFRKGVMPHGDYVKRYFNRVALSNTEALPEGAVIVLENYDENKRLISINVMQRSAGFNPRNGDWYYVTYLPNGTVAKALGKRGEIPFAGKVISCIECHRDAWDDDQVFFND